MPNEKSFLTRSDSIRNFILITIVFILSLPLFALTEKEYYMILIIGKAYNIPFSITSQLMIEESSCDELQDGQIVNGYKAKGLFQIYTEPKNYNYLLWKYWNTNTVFDIYNPIYNSIVSLHYLSDLHKRFGNWKHALYYYNCGYINNVPNSTRKFAKRITNASYKTYKDLFR
jgi:hypothetical protein